MSTVQQDARKQNRSHLKRYSQIAAVLGRHGFGHVLARLGIGRLAPWHWIHRRNGRDRTRPPEEVRQILEELGTTFMKMGQILSTRPDIVAPEFQRELAKLQDAAPPVPVDAVKAVILRELGKPVEQLFKQFDDVPLATATIGQVHAALLHDGSDVVVKVMRPNVVEQVELDLEILASLAKRAEKVWDWARQYDLTGLVREFAETMQRELDYAGEARNADRFRENFKNDPTIHVPRVFHEFSTDRVLTLERIRGIKVNDVQALRRAGFDPHKVADQAIGPLLKMVFEDRFFHADPHPGNVMIEKDGRIGVIDFGMVGTLDDDTLEGLMKLVLSFLESTPDRVVDAMEELGITGRELDRVALRRDIDFLTGKYQASSVDQISTRVLIDEVLEVARKHHLRVPPHLAMLLKTLIMAEGVGAELDPTFNLTQRIRPYAGDYLYGKKSFKRNAKKFAQAGLDALGLATELPIRLRRILMDVERGGLGINVRHAGLEEAVQRVDKAVNRLVLGVLTAALLVGLAVVLSVADLPGKSTWLSAFFGVGLTTVLGLLAYLGWRLGRGSR
ncbi:MAG: AarF/ABC1/UbiB kinase family protein [Chloroflexi bacterium]|nr:AarF/ABC1/UbiB kinase family protein [Chloroflexota bacterium]